MQHTHALSFQTPQALKEHKVHNFLSLSSLSLSSVLLSPLITMTCILNCSHGVVIATAMVFSSTALYLTISRQFSANRTSSSDQQILRSCLFSEKKTKQRKKKKKVKFAEDVKEPKGNGEEYRRRRIVPEPVSKPEKTGLVCRNDMPANRIALYNGLLRDRVHRIQCS